MFKMSISCVLHLDMFWCVLHHGGVSFRMSIRCVLHPESMSRVSNKCALHPKTLVHLGQVVSLSRSKFASEIEDWAAKGYLKNIN